MPAGEILTPGTVISKYSLFKTARRASRRDFYELPSDILKAERVSYISLEGAHDHIGRDLTVGIGGGDPRINLIFENESFTERWEISRLLLGDRSETLGYRLAYLPGINYSSVLGEIPRVGQEWVADGNLSFLKGADFATLTRTIFLAYETTVAGRREE